MVSIKITWEGQGIEAEDRSENKDFFMTFQGLEGCLVVAEWSQGCDVEEGSGGEFWRYQLPPMERLVLSRLDMAASVWKLINVDLPYWAGMSYVH